MEAARVAALRGHQVILYEKEPRLGGQLIQAAVPPYKNGIEVLNEYLQTQLKKLRVQVKVGEELTVQKAEQIKPDDVIVATGARPIIPNILGVNGQNVVTALEVLSGTRAVGKRVIIVGGGQVGCETAEFLADNGKKVTILEMLWEIGTDMLSIMRPFVIRRLNQAGIMMETRVEITDKGVTATHNGALKFFEGDTVVLAVGMESETKAQWLRARLPSVHLVGDVVKPRTVGEAMAEGYLVGLKM